jgi:DNA-directed RNA polymerase specialized sigma24 family protein
MSELMDGSKTSARATEAFEALFAGVANTAYGIAFRFTRNQADAEDLVQEAALLAYLAAGPSARSDGRDQ